jgi:formate hydrogenlyase transcriptional activator
LVIPAVNEETRFPASIKFLRDGIRSICALPLTTVHRRLGALGLGSQQADAYSSEEVRFLSLVANQVALALDDCLNHEASVRTQEELQQKQAELQRKRDRLRLLLDVTNRMVSNLELRDLLREISASVRRVMQCDGVAVALPDSEGHQLRLYAVDFPESKGLVTEGRLIPIDKSPLGTAFRTGEDIKCSCFIPLVRRNRSVGVLALARLGESGARTSLMLVGAKHARACAPIVTAQSLNAQTKDAPPWGE